MQKPILIALTAAIVTAGAGFATIYFFFDAAEPAPAAAPPPIPVVATTVVQHDVPIYLRDERRVAETVPVAAE
jgi:membrane fusion protein, multidrug efflux system